MNRTRVREIIAAALAEGRTALSEIESKRILDQVGVPTAMAEPAATAEEVSRLASRVGFPVVLKVLSPQVSHKSEVGGVELNLRCAEDARQAFERIRRNLGAKAPGARFDGVTVQAMAPPGLELIAGLNRDERFGPLVMVGLGGTLVEILGDTALRLAPVDVDEARAMLLGLRAAPLLRGVRGSAGVDIVALSALVARLSEFATGTPELVEMDLNPIVAYPDGLKVLDARILVGAPRAAGKSDPHRAERLANLGRAFEARTAAVIGDRRVRGYMWLHALERFKGKLYSVQFDRSEIAGIEAMGIENRISIAEVPAHIDYALSAVPRHAAPQVLKECVQAGVGAISFFTAGFSETGEDSGKQLEQELKDIAFNSDIAVIGPNCMGLYSPGVGLRNFADQDLCEPAGACLVSQSGTHTTNFVAQAQARGIAVNKAASMGNAIVLEAADYIELMAADPKTRVIGIYIEGVGDGRRFFESVRHAAQRLPVLIWRGGTSQAGVRAAFSHTGALTTPTAVWAAVIRQSGAVQVGSLDAMLDAIELITRGREVKGRRMGLITMGGGQSVTITDVFANAGLEVPVLSKSSYQELESFFSLVGASFRNPLDAGWVLGLGGANPDNLNRVLSTLDRDPVIDAIVLDAHAGVLSPAWARNEKELTSLLDPFAEFTKRTRKPTAIVLHDAGAEMLIARARKMARDRGLVVFNNFERAAAAFQTVAEACDARARMRE